MSTRVDTVKVEEGQRGFWRDGYQPRYTEPEYRFRVTIELRTDDPEFVARLLDLMGYRGDVEFSKGKRPELVSAAPALPPGPSVVHEAEVIEEDAASDDP